MPTVPFQGAGVSEMLWRALNKIRGFREMLAFDNGFALAVDRMVHPRARLAIYRRGNLEIAVDRSGGDLASIRLCLATPMYRRLLSGLSLEPTINVLDVGANVGGFSFLLIDLGFSFRKLVAVELNPNTTVRLRANLLGNLHDRTSRVVVLTTGVWFEAGTLRQDFGWGNTGDRIAMNASSTIALDEVPLRTLDNLIDAEFADEIIDICKIDVEGAEYDILAHRGHERLRQTRYILIEIHERTGHSDSDVVTALGELGCTLMRQTATTGDRVCLFRNDRLADNGKPTIAESR